MPQPGQLRDLFLGPCRAKPARRSAVRRSCQTIARRGAARVERSQITAVSRWLVMPTQAMAGSPPADAQRLAAGRECRLPDVFRQMLHPARFREVLAEFLVSAARHRAVIGDDKAVTPVVPASIARTLMGTSVAGNNAKGALMRVGVLTGGGDCPGLNAVIRAELCVPAWRSRDGVHRIP